VGSRKPALGFIFITLMLDVLGFGLLIPVGPRLIEDLQHGGVVQAATQPGVEAQAAGAVGLLASTYAVMQFLLAPILGSLSDRFGRRPVLLIALFGSGLDYFAMALAPSLWILFVTRAINGLSGASFTVGSAYVADVTPPEKRAAGFGLIGAAFGLGFVIGPAIGGFLGEHNHRWPFVAAGCLTLLNWLYGLFVLPESLPSERRGHFSLKRANPIGAFYGLGRYPFVARMAAAFFFLNLAQFGLHATWALYTQLRFEWGPRAIGWSLFAVGIGAAVVQAGLARRLIPVLGERRAVVAGLALSVLAYVGYGLANHGWMMYVVIAIGSLAGIGMPALQAMISHTVRPTEQGAVQGALTAVNNVAQIVGPLIGTGVFQHFVSDTIATKVPGAAFFSSAILALIGWVVVVWAMNSAPPSAVALPGVGAGAAAPESVGVGTK
jgi:DHA1 family tetracycline resistance protein-like MFS transporter